MEIARQQTKTANTMHNTQRAVQKTAVEKIPAGRIIDAMTRLPLLAVLLLFSFTAPAKPLPDGEPVRGWTLLSDSEPDDLATIAAAPAYHINHVQLSHLIVMDLRDLKDDKKCAQVNRLIDAAHAAGVTEVVLWDHAFYPLNYYPEKFRTGPGNTIDLDSPAFWKWFK